MSPTGRESERTRGELLTTGAHSPCKALMFRTFGVETGDLRTEQERAIAEQDQGLDMLAEVIRRQRGMGEDIFREVTHQNDLIDDIDDRVENVNQRLLDTTSNVRVVAKKDRTCGYWIVILLLAIAIIAVLAS